MQEPRLVLKKIIKVVVVTHLVLIISVSVNFKKKPSKQIYMAKALKENFRTIEKPRPKVKKATPKKVVAVKKAAPQKIRTPKPAQKKEVKVAKAKELPKIMPMKESSDIKLPELILPQAVATLNVETETQESFEDVEDTFTNNPYETYLASVIQEELGLKPGAFVSFEISLSCQGRVIYVKHLESSDTFSKDFIIENIKHLQFADFFGEMATESEYTFVIRTKNSKI